MRWLSPKSWSMLKSWTQIPPAPPVCAATEFVMDSSTTYSAQVPALKYKIVWNGSPQPPITLQINERQELFSSPTVVIVENANASNLVTVGVRQGIGSSSTVSSFNLPPCGVGTWGIGGRKVPTMLGMASGADVVVTAFACVDEATYLHQVPALYYNIIWTGSSPPPVTLQNALNKPLFDSPHFVIIRNSNAAGPITIKVKLGDGTVTSIVLLSGQARLCLLSSASAGGAPLFDADRATSAVFGLTGYLNKYFEISSVMLCSLQEPAATYNITVQTSSDICFQGAGETPLFKEAFSDFHLGALLGNVILEVKNNNLDRYVTWRTSQGVANLGTLHGGDHAKLIWNGKLLDAPVMNIAW